MVESADYLSLLSIKCVKYTFIRWINWIIQKLNTGTVYSSTVQVSPFFYSSCYLCYGVIKWNGILMLKMNIVPSICSYSQKAFCSDWFELDGARLSYRNSIFFVEIWRRDPTVEYLNKKFHWCAFSLNITYFTFWISIKLPN